jgi:phosphotransferase system HPr (HPr) family protein
MLADSVQGFSSRVTIAKESGGPPVDARSALSVIGLDVKHGDAVLVVAEGADAADAIKSLRSFIENRLVKGDELPPATPAVRDGAGLRSQLPIGLRRLGIPHVQGRSVCAGIGIGAAVIVDGLSLPAKIRDAKPGPLED